MFSVRRATPDDAALLIALLKEIAAERIYTAITKPWSAVEQKQHMVTLSPREVIHVAETDTKELLGYQALELWAPTISSMAHVGQIGTFVVTSARGQGVGTALFRETLGFARASGYAKFVIQVRSQNIRGQAFYRRLGFAECGRLSRQVRAYGEEDDEVIMELFL